MYSQAKVREESVLRPPTRALPSVIVDTEKVLREADGSVKLVVVRPHTDGKVFAPGCASKPDGESREKPEEHKRDSRKYENWTSIGSHDQFSALQIMELKFEFGQ